ncbi:MAG: SDR family oxidoreductase [Planctomycetota bacterium]|jgi:nucleoside-diphosphate-sugar epimerase
MAKALVTGGAGFIGSHLARGLVSRGHEVRVLDNLSSGKLANLDGVIDDIDLHQEDMRDASACDRAVAGMEFMFHEAAIPSVPKSIDEPLASHDANMNGTFNLLSAAVKHKLRRVIYAGSSSAYGDVEESPKHEEIKPAPLSPYAVQKLAGEHYCSAFCESWGLETITIRYFNVFGPQQDPASTYAAAIPAFVTAILRGDQPVIYGDGEQTRDFTYIENVVEGNMRAMAVERTHGETVNVACGGQISINRTIAAINNLLGTDVAPRYLDARAGDVKHSCADISLAKSLLNYAPVVDFEEGLRRTIDYYKGLAT